MAKKLNILASSILLVGFFILFTNSIIEDQVSRKEKSKIEYNLPYIPKNVNFAGEKTPIEEYDIKEALDNEMLSNAFWQSQIFRFIKRANRFFPVIEPILKKNNIPDDFKYLAVAESGLDNLISPSHAEGKWQFLKTTAREYGLTINKYVDERYHLKKATQAACNYFNKSYETYHNWTLVAASFNMGINGLSKSLENQNVSSYYDLHLNKETGRYIYRIIAIKLIMETPKKYGFNFSKSDLYPIIPTTNINVDTTINDLRRYAIEQNCNYKILKQLNPWLRNTSLPVSTNKSYQLLLPKKGFRNFADSSTKK